MYRILKKAKLATKTYEFLILAHEISQKAQAGQFVIIRVDEQAERIPLTIADTDPLHGSVTLVVLETGLSTHILCSLQKDDSIQDIVGPMGRPTEIKKVGRVIGVGGGVGIAALYPVVREFKKAGNEVISIIGVKSKEYLFWEEKIKEVSSEVLVSTDDGSYGYKGFVTDVLKEALEKRIPDFVFVVGPTIMMKAVADLTKGYNVKTIASLNPIMVDGSGMCGACRVSVGGKTYFACVDGPDFDAHQVDFELLLKRLAMYKKEEEDLYRGFTTQQ